MEYEYLNVYFLPQGGRKQERSLSLPVICHSNCSSAENELEKMENMTRFSLRGCWCTICCTTVGFVIKLNYFKDL